MTAIIEKPDIRPEQKISTAIDEVLTAQPHLFNGIKNPKKMLLYWLIIDQYAQFPFALTREECHYLKELRNYWEYVQHEVDPQLEIEYLIESIFIHVPEVFNNFPNAKQTILQWLTTDPDLEFPRILTVEEADYLQALMLDWWVMQNQCTPSIRPLNPTRRTTSHSKYDGSFSGMFDFSAVAA